MAAKKYDGWCILVDCDGTLTNGQKEVDTEGERVSISFNSRDAVACKQLVRLGFRVIIVTHSKFHGVPKYWDKYGAETFWALRGDEMTNKLDVFKHYPIDQEKCIAIGDDITDNCFLEVCKYRYIVADPHPFYTSKDLELWMGRSVYPTGNPKSPKRLPCKGGDGVLAYIYQFIQLGVYAND